MAPRERPPLFGTLSSNFEGRTFFVGDLHGQRDLFDLLLKAVDFDTERDRVISMGDLPDRGPFSIRCLELVCHPWFLSVQGNHETAFVEAVDEMAATGDFHPSARMGNAWLSPAFKYGPQALVDLAEKVRNLPCVLVHYGAAPSDRFHVVHASLHGGQSVLTDRDIDWLVENENMLTGKQYRASRARYTWNSKAFDLSQSVACVDSVEPGAVDVMNPAWAAGLSLTFCGHLIVPDTPKLALSHLHIDTGASSSDYYSNCALSFIERTNISSAGFNIEVTQASPFWGIRRSRGFVAAPTASPLPKSELNKRARMAAVVPSPAPRS